MTALSKIETALEKRMVAAGMPIERIKRELSFANQAVMRDTMLQDATKESLAAAVVNIANIGLTLNPVAKEAALIARYNGRTKQVEATLMPMYPGLVKLAQRAGAVKSIVTNVVYENDTFEIDLVDAFCPVKKHSPHLIQSERGRKLGAYSLATLSNGSRQAEWMPIDDIYYIRNQADSYKNEKARPHSPWVRFEDEMIRKTVLKRICKYLPRTERPEQELFDNAIDLDNRDYPASMNQILAIENLLMSANISPEREREIYRERDSYTHDEASKVIEYLTENQMNDVRYTDSRALSAKERAKQAIDAADDPKR